MDIFSAYTYGTAAWFSIQALPLLLTPRLVLTMLSTETRQATDLETYFCRSLALTLFTLAVLTVLLTGLVPLTSTFAESSGVSTDPSDPKAYALPTVTVTTISHASSAFYSYMRYTQTGQAGFALGVAGCGGLGAMVLWCLMFANSRGRISRKTGADKRTSGFPFANAEADKKKVGRKRVEVA